MKLILAIVHNDDANTLSAALTKAGFFTTKLATTGGFLKAGNTTFITGVDDERVGDALSVIKKHSSQRTQITSDVGMFADASYTPMPVEVTVGGATVFVLDVEQFYKL